MHGSRTQTGQSVDVRRIIVDSDIIRDHVFGSRRPSVLRTALNRCFCYTTVFSVIELFARAGSSGEERAIEDALAGTKLLGLNARSAKHHAGLWRAYPRTDRWALLVAGLCLEAGLPLLTGRPALYRGVRRLKIVTPEGLERMPLAGVAASGVDGRERVTR